MLKKIVIIRSVVTTLVSLLIFGIISTVMIDYLNKDRVKTDIMRDTAIIKNAMQHDDNVENIDYFIVGLDDIRVTLMDNMGVVLLDTALNPADLENHLMRDEVQSALKGENNVFTRYSNTIGKRMMYYAETVNISSGQYVLRLALDIGEINSFIYGALTTLIILILVCIVATLFISKYTGNKILSPFNVIKASLQDINSGDYTPKEVVFDDENIDSVMQEIYECSSIINSTLAERKREKSKLDYILNNMGQGIIAINVNCQVVLKNDLAEEIYSSELLLGCNLFEMIEDDKLKTCVLNVIQNAVSTSFNDEIDGVPYEMSIIGVNEKWQNENRELIVVITIRNLSDVIIAEKSRREFFANASHELKTPLTSIKGFAELLESGMAEDEEKRMQYINKISQNSNRMLTLIEDMLKISHLDEKIDESSMYVNVNIKNIALAVISNLTVLANEKNIKIESELQEAIINGSVEDFTELIQNLVENAIKYNKPNGFVKVRVLWQGGKIVIAVEDNGIGIPLKHQTRVFERFYRVDKGRSRNVGGTGLGLSIVKHIAQKYDGEITLRSSDKGTDIRITF